MDTNTLNLILTALASKAQSNETMAIVDLILKALAPVLAGVAVYFARAAQVKTQEVHAAVNGSHTLMVAELKSAQENILRISTELSTLREQKRGQETAAALATAEKS